jgi:hypothetical protein
MVGRLVASATIADHAVAGDLCAAVPTIRLADVRICRNEYFIRVHIYARGGILTHVISTLPTIAAEHFPSFWSEIGSPIL